MWDNAVRLNLKIWVSTRICVLYNIHIMSPATITACKHSGSNSCRAVPELFLAAFFGLMHLLGHLHCHVTCFHFYTLYTTSARFVWYVWSSCWIGSLLLPGNTDVSGRFVRLHSQQICSQLDNWPASQLKANKSSVSSNCYSDHRCVWVYVWKVCP